MRTKFFLIIISIPILFSACQEEDILVTTTDEETVETTSHTALVYIVADNSLNSYASSDIDEMLEGYADVDDTANNHLLVYLDDYDTPNLFQIKKEGDEVVTDTLYSYAEQNSLDIDIMSGVINQALSACEADSYGLVLWSHGSGWLPGTDDDEDEVSTKAYGEDLNNNSSAEGTQMDILDLKTALEACPKFEYILFDACDMQGIEVAYELKNCANYIIASPGEIPAYGAPYEDVVPAFFSDIDNIAETIAEAYYDDYESSYSYGSTSNNDNIPGNSGGLGGYTGGSGNSTEYPYGISISVIDCNKLDDLASATKDIISQYITDSASVETSDILSYDDNYYNFYYDLDGFIKSLTSEGDDYTTWKEAYDEAVPLFLTTEYVYSSYANDGEGGMSSMEDATGVSTYIPANANFFDAYYWSFYLKYYPQYTATIKAYQTYYNEYYQDYSWYSAAGWSTTGW